MTENEMRYDMFKLSEKNKQTNERKKERKTKYKQQTEFSSCV